MYKGADGAIFDPRTLRRKYTVIIFSGVKKTRREGRRQARRVKDEWLRRCTRKRNEWFSIPKECDEETGRENKNERKKE